jgi:hypothetical protein
VRIYTGATATGTPVSISATRSGGSWSVEPGSALAGGTYTVTATQADDAGNSTDTAPRTFTLDTAAPAVTLDAPAAGSSSTDTTPTFSGLAGTAGGDVATVRVKIYAGAVAAGTAVQTLTATPAGSAWSADAAPLAVGVYTARAEQLDDVGNLGLSAARTFSVAAEPVTPTTPTDPGPTSPGEPTPSPPADTQAPTGTFGAVKATTFLTTGALTFGLQLDEAADVTGELLVSAADAKKLKLAGAKTSQATMAGAKYVRIGQVHKSLAGGASQLKLSVAKALRARLKKATKLKLTIRVTLLDTAMNKRVVTKTVTAKKK